MFDVTVVLDAGVVAIDDEEVENNRDTKRDKHVNNAESNGHLKPNDTRHDQIGENHRHDPKSGRLERLDLLPRRLPTKFRREERLHHGEGSTAEGARSSFGYVIHGQNTKCANPRRCMHDLEAVSGIKQKITRQWNKDSRCGKVVTAVSRDPDEELVRSYQTGRWHMLASGTRTWIELTLEMVGARRQTPLTTTAKTTTESGNDTGSSTEITRIPIIKATKCNNQQKLRFDACGTGYVSIETVFKKFNEYKSRS